MTILLHFGTPLKKFKLQVSLWVYLQVSLWAYLHIQCIGVWTELCHTLSWVCEGAHWGSMHQARASGHENVTVKVTGKWVKNVVCGMYVHGGGGICGTSAGRRGTPKLLGIALFNFRKAPDIHLNLLIFGISTSWRRFHLQQCFVPHPRRKVESSVLEFLSGRTKDLSFCHVIFRWERFPDPTLNAA